MQQRPTWHEFHMDICEVARKRSTCLRIQTGTIIERNNRILSTGYNGSVSGSQHCCDYWFEKFQNDDNYAIFEKFLRSDEFYYEHHKWSIENELHGEMNAILHAGKIGVTLEGSTLYTTYSPCINCAKAIVSSGIKKVFFKCLYKRDDRGIKFLATHKIVCNKI